MPQHAFISHSSKDDVVIAAIREALDEHRIGVWVDSKHLLAGDKLEPVIEQEIRAALHFVVVLSRTALKSKWVRKEVEFARQIAAERPDFKIVPLVLDGIKSATVTEWFGEDIVAVRLPDRSTESLTRGVAELLAALGIIDLLAEPEPDDDQRPLSDLILELTQPAMFTEGGVSRAAATARLVHQPHEGSAVAGQAFSFTAPLGPIEAGDLRWYLESYFRWTSDVFRERANQIEEDLPKWGRRLFDAALATPEAVAVLEGWRHLPPGAEALRRFTVFVDSAVPDGADDPARIAADEAATLLLALPWELIHDKSGYLFQGAQGIRVRRRLPDADVMNAEPTKPPIRVLLVSPRPEDEQAGYIDHRSSARPVVDALAELGALARLTLLDPPTFPALDAELRRAFEAGQPYHVVHFDGHGVYDKRHGWGELCFEHPDDVALSEHRRSQNISADQLAASLRDHRIPLFVLDACESSKAEDDPTASVAGRLLACGVSSVVAMSHTVLVETARRFVAVFYRELVSGQRVGQAMLAAQHALFQDTYRLDTFSGPLHMQDWFVPVLFQERPDPRMLERLPSAQMRAATANARKLALGDLPQQAPKHAFVGRSRQLLAAERQLCGTRLQPYLGQKQRPQDARYVVFVGEGGEGKTTLAVELARWLIETERFDRAAFVSVEHEASVHSVLHALGEQLVSNYVGQTQGNDEAGRKLLAKTLADHPSLLVIDNLESILPRVGVPPTGTSSTSPTESQPTAPFPAADRNHQDSLSSDILVPLLQLLSALNVVGQTRIIFTTRTPLPEPFAAHSIRLDRLSRTEAIELVGEVLRAEEAAPRAGDAGHTKAEIEALVEAVNCHARSLVLLSQELKRSGVSAVTADLTELMRRLHQRYPNDRERSLFASLELSLRRLSPEVRRLVPKLAVFHGGGHAWAIAQVLGLDYSQDEEQRVIFELIHVGLAQAIRYGHVRLEPALGPYLKSELTEPERQGIESAWLDAMTQLSNFLYTQRSKDPQPTATLTLLELPNLMAALQQRATVAFARLLVEPESEVPPSGERECEALETIVGMATDMESLLQYLGRPQALGRSAEIRGLAAAQLARLQGDDGWSHAQFAAANEAINRLLDGGRSKEAVEGARLLLRRCERAGESAYDDAAYDIAQANFKVGRALQMHGAAADALAPLAEARGRFERIAANGIAVAARMATASLSDYAICLCDLGRLDEAAQKYEQTIEEAKSQNAERTVASNKGQLGTVRQLQHRYSEALAAWDEARQTFENLGEHGTVAVAWHQIGNIHEAAGQYDRAEHAYQQSLSIKVGLGNRMGEATTLGQLGNLYSRLGHREEAVRFYRQAAEIFSSPDIQNLTGEGRSRNNVAGELIQLGRQDEARREIIRAIDCKSGVGHVAEIWKAFLILSKIELAAGDFPAFVAARSRAIDAYLAYRCDGGENQSNSATEKLSKQVFTAITEGQTATTAAQLDEFSRRSDLPAYLVPVIPALQAILAGSRDLAIVSDERLQYDDAAELLLLLKRLNAVESEQ